jgi:MFS family permease
VLAVLLPALSAYFVKQLNVSSTIRDKRLTQTSGSFLILGSTATFLATSPILLITGQVLFSLGYSFGVTATSLITGLVEQKHLGVLYTSIATMTYCGIVVGGPLLASTFSWGMQLGGFCVGLPFLITAGFFLIGTVAVSASNLAL